METAQEQMISQWMVIGLIVLGVVARWVPHSNSGATNSGATLPNFCGRACGGLGQGEDAEAVLSTHGRRAASSAVTIAHDQRLQAFETSAAPQLGIGVAQYVPRFADSTA